MCLFVCVIQGFNNVSEKRRHSGHPIMHYILVLPSVTTIMFDQHHRVSVYLNMACKAHNPMQKISWFPIFYTIFSSHLSIKKLDHQGNKKQKWKEHTQILPIICFFSLMIHIYTVYTVLENYFFNGKPCTKDSTGNQFK